MPVDDGTHFDIPIPLRDNENRVMPNPYTRLQAADRVRERLQLLAGVAGEAGRPADVVGLAGVLEALGADLRAAIWGDLAECEQLTEGARLTLWAQTACPIVWPLAGPAAAGGSEPAAAGRPAGPAPAGSPRPGQPGELLEDDVTPG